DGNGRAIEMKQEQPFIGVMRSSAFPRFPATRIAAHGFRFPAMEYAVGVV
ncbi:631_t:CDS:2, partial [Rhizophagus irregularis]